MFSPTLPAPFPPQNDADRAALLDWIRGVSLVYGPWQAFKRLFKDAESAYSNAGQSRETEIFAALMARLDGAVFVDEARDKGAAPPVVRGNFDALHIANDLLYSVEGSALAVFDLSAPLEPREVFRYTPPVGEYSYYSRLWVQANRLCYGSAHSLLVFDLSNPRAPHFLFEANAGRANAIGVVGDQVFVSDYENLRVLSLPASGGTALTELGRAPLQYAYNLVAKPGLIGVSHYANRGYKITFFDVSDPQNPTQVSQINSQNSNSWEFIGDILARLDGNQLVFTDLAKPKNPREISKIDVSGARTFHVAGDKIFVACQNWRNENGRYGYENKLRVIDISQIHSPRLLGETDATASQLTAYQNLLYVSDGGLKILDVSDPARIQPVGQRPKNATFAYLKRRSRRFLRLLAQADANAFVELAGAFLLEAGQGHDALSLKDGWTSAELTLGGGARWHQSSHGRGAYVKDAAKLIIKTREERAPQAWDAHPETARALWNHPHLPWQTQEMALKILRAHGENPPPTAAQLSRFLWSNSPALLGYAARQARPRLNELETRAFAPLLWISNPTQRREILGFLENSADLQTQTATLLATLLGQNADAGLSRRAREIALLLAARFDLSAPTFSSDGAFVAIPALLASAEAPLRALGLDFCRRLSAPRALEALGYLLQIPANQRESFLNALVESASRGALEMVEIDKSVRHADESLRAAAWRIIAASQTSNEVMRAVWTRLFTGLRRDSLYEGERYTSRYLGEQWIESATLQSAINSDAALLTLGRCELTAGDVKPNFSTPLYTGEERTQISPAMWGAYSLILPAKTVVEVFVKAPTWTAWQSAWVRANVPHAAKLAAFWQGVQEFLAGERPEADKETLRRRTFEQSAVAATFGGAASQLSPVLLMSLIGAIPDDLWIQWRSSLLLTLQNDAATREAFWSAARQSPGLESGFLRARLLEDADFAATFGLLETDALAADNPAFTPLILAWLRAREANLDSQGWIDAAIHPLPDVRDYGLARLEIVGLNVAGALQLLESRLPPSIEFGRQWFQNRGENELESALALCDSPQLAVRAIGREFIAAHFETLLQAGLIGYLQENPNAEMQGFVAAQLNQKPELAAPDFDRAVLRSRNRARRAKNLIQARTTQNAPLADTKTLLEIARGRTPRDAEWALSQLARRALDGGAVEGVEVGDLAAI